MVAPLVGFAPSTPARNRPGWFYIRDPFDPHPPNATFGWLTVHLEKALGISGIFQPVRDLSLSVRLLVHASNAAPLPLRNHAAVSPSPIHPTVAPLVGLAPSCPAHTKSGALELWVNLRTKRSVLGAMWPRHRKRYVSWLIEISCGY
jgi:hypothetical protein